MDVILNNILRDPRYHDLLAILKGTKNGIVYGAKLRFSHALVMSFLFHNSKKGSRWPHILRSTKQHAKSLGLFVFIYKSLLVLLKHAAKLAGSATARSASLSSVKNDVTSNKNPLDAFIAGLVAGYIVFGRPTKSAGLNSINQQMVLYVFSRVVLGFANLALRHFLASKKVVNSSAQRQRDYLNSGFISNSTWAVFASLSWACVMCLFRIDSTLLQNSMVHSMKYLYVDSEFWTSILDF
jgi:peroxisomal membrane protein 4